MRIRRRLLHWKPVIKLMRLFRIPFSYAQNKEDLMIAEYFGDFKGNLLSIGENDGRTFSNVLYFILRGWYSDLIEPSIKSFIRLTELHYRNEKVMCHQLAISKQTEHAIFYDCGELVGIGDSGLVSSLKVEETSKWGIPYEKTHVDALTFCDFMIERAENRTYDLISIDAEGMDWDILQQMNLYNLGCRCLIIEHGGDKELIQKMKSYCFGHGLYDIKTTYENIIFVR